MLKSDRYERAGLSNHNCRNGSYERKMNTIYGELNLVIPRDRKGDFDSPLVPKYEQCNTGTEELIAKLFNTGLTNAEIADIVEALYNMKYSRGPISNITDQVIENVEAFRKRPLSKEYAAIYPEATYVPLLRDTVQKEAIHIVLGSRMEGTKEQLSYAVAPSGSVTK